MADEEDVVRLSRGVHVAWAESQIAVLQALIAPAYHHVDIYGEVFDREGWLAYAAAPRSPGNVHTEEEQVAIIGDVAVLTSTVRLSDFADAPVVRLTEVWTRIGGGWLRSWYQATSAEPAE